MLQLTRGSLYYQPQEVSTSELALLRQIDELHLKYPFFGSRGLVNWLREREGVRVNRKRMQRLMRILGIESMAPKPNLSKPNKAHPVFPYLLRGLSVVRPNQVWATDITYIPLENGYVYLVAVIDWFSRKVLSFRLSNTLDSSFCVDALEEALSKFGPPEIFNSDQGVQFKSAAFTQVLLKNGIKISMDGKGRCLDNVFVERLWRSLKYEDVYLRRYSFMDEAKRGIGEYLKFFNEERPHQSFKGKTPDAVYFGSIGRPNKKAA